MFGNPKSDHGVETMHACYIGLTLLRFVLTVAPQTGYIHPDEYFQSPEIVYGDLLELQAFRPWEFKPSNPLRCISFPYVTVGIPAMVVKFLGGFRFFGTSFFSYLLLILPRLLMCFLSLTHDFCILKVCRLLKVRSTPYLVIYASSYVTLVHYTRTFSNCTESVCYTLLSYLVLKDYLRFEESKRSAEKSNANANYLFGILLAIGFFIRPTFLVFAFVPMVFWILFSTESVWDMLKKMLLCVPGFVTVTVFLAAVDTVYYLGDVLTFPGFTNIYECFESLIFTPINFIRYNSNAQNVASHGDHPRWLHFLVNVPMTFTVLGLYALYRTLRAAFTLMRRRRLSGSKLETYFLLSFVFPVFVLSVMPHQEPRFLIPLLFPLVFLCANSLYEHCAKLKSVAALWIIANLAGLLVFGFFHQGGMYSAVSYFHTVLNKDTSRNFDLVFYHTYLPPRHLMAVPSMKRHVRVHDVLERPEEQLITTVERIFRRSRHGDVLYIIVPSAATVSIVNVNIMLNPDYRVRLEKSFFPHLSTEDLYLYNLWQAMTSKASFGYKLRKLKAFFSLDVYKVEAINS